MKDCIIINDYSAFGSNSLAVGLPVLAALGVKAHAFPSAVLSAQTEFSGYAKTELNLAPFFAMAKEQFSPAPALLSGYLSSVRQAKELKAYLEQARPTPYLLDPVLGDGGALYHGFTPKNVQAVRSLLPYATLVTPNLTEAALLTGADYKSLISSCEKEGATAALALAERLVECGAKAVAITGVCHKAEIQTLLLADGKSHVISKPLKRESRSGMGDLFAALAFGYLLCGKNLSSACTRAAKLAALALDATEQKDGRLGTDFEKILPLLCAEQP